jgi:hypothetical protein|tara:strand:+ start:3728 stop:3973 length:246 start_codon:yes stop_codon:yes gene_type:complete
MVIRVLEIAARIALGTSGASHPYLPDCMQKDIAVGSGYVDVYLDPTVGFVTPRGLRFLDQTITPVTLSPITAKPTTVAIIR